MKLFNNKYICINIQLKKVTKELKGIIIRSVDFYAIAIIALTNHIYVVFSTNVTIWKLVIFDK